MVIAKIYVDGVSAKVTDLQKIPKGIAGAVIEVTYAANWEGLTKTAVFAGAVTRDVLNADGDILVPTETVARSGYRLRVGFYGVDGEKNVIIPTLWADLGTVQDAADPSGDPGTNPELPVWAQLQKEFEELKEAGGLIGPQGPAGPQGEQGPEGPQGIPGDDYVLTEADKAEIAEMAAGLVEVPEAPVVSMKPLTFTGAVNATYDGSEEMTVEIPQGGGGEWQLLYDDTITLTEPVNRITASLLKSCEGMTRFFAKVNYTARQNDMDSLLGMTVGKFSPSYGFLGNTKTASNVILYGEILDDTNSMLIRANGTANPEYSSLTATVGFPRNAINPDYTLCSFACVGANNTYQGSITAKIYGC